VEAKSAGVDIHSLIFCVLPYGTGNDLARVTGWGGEPNLKFYKSLKSLVKEICLNSTEEKFNVWEIAVNF
jgi:diacylglycerol kinase family enzyme